MWRVWLGLVLGGVGLAQPVIQPPLQSSPTTSQVPTLGNAITSGTPISGFLLYINGAFNVDTTILVTWLNPNSGATGFTTSSGIQRVGASQIVVLIPGSLFSTPVSNPVSVDVTVTQTLPGSVQQRVVSNPASFIINPPLASTGSTLPAGTAGTVYSQNLYTGGTAPYGNTISAGTLPPGLTLPPTGGLLIGTPTTPGNYSFTAHVSDAWNNMLTVADSLQIVGTPTITPPLVPASTPAGSPTLQITITGTNFLAPGSIARWTAPGSDPLPLATTVSSATQAVATIPSSFLQSPVTAGITMVQPNGVSSNSVPFQVLAPTITSLSPPSAAAGSPAFTLTVTGANFLNGSQVFFGSTALTTTFQSSTSLTAPVTAALIANPGAIMVTVANPGGSRSAAATFTVGQPTLQITTGSPLPTGTVGTAYSTGFAASGGSPPYTFALTGTAPPGLSLSQATLSGTPTTAGQYSFGITVTDSANGSASKQFTLLVQPAALTVTTASLPNGQVGVAYSAQLAATGGTPPYTWAASGLPAGITATIAGVLSGTPTASGSFNIAATVTDSAGAQASKTFPITIAPASLTITTASLPNGQVGVAYNAQLAATGGTPPYTWAASGLPAGITATTAGVLSGTPTASGSFNATVTVTDTAGTQVSKTLALTIASSSLTITTTSLPNATPGTAYSATLAATGGTPPYTWVVNGLPSGITATPSGVLGGTPTISGSFTVAATVTDSAGVQASRTFSLVVASSGLTVVTTSLPNGVVGTPYFTALFASGGTPPYTWVVNGLPPGITASSAGALSGTPTATGSFNVAVTVTDSAGAQASKSFSMVVAGLSITTTSLPNGVVGAAYSATLAATGGTPPYSWAVSGLPAGISATTAGVLSGTPTAAGPFNIAVTATDITGVQATKTFSITIAAAGLTITSASLPNGVVGTAYSATLAAGGGTPPYTWAASGLPQGITATTAGVLSGTPTVAGSFNIAVTVTDSAGAQASKTFSITIAQAVLTITTASLPNGLVGTAYSATLAARGGAPPYTWAVSGLPAGITATTGGVLSGTPTASGPFNVNATATDSAGAQSSKTFSIVIAAAGLTITTTSLPDGMIEAAYSATLAAAGGTPPYSWSVTGLPEGLSASGSGAISGTPTAAGAFNVGATVTDSKNVTATASLTLMIAAAPLTITTTTLAAGTAGTGVSITLAASGGVPPYNWVIGGLPPGVSGSSAGAISGTPTAPGSFTVTATVTDSAGATASANLPWTIALPAAPALTFTGVPTNINPGSQSTLQVSLGAAYPVDVTVGLTLTFAPTSGADDPAVQFSTGGRTANITVPAGQTTGATSVGVQAGTVAGTITITAQLTAAGQNVTPAPPPTKTIQVPATAPVITAISAASNSTGFTVSVTGYSSTRDVSTALFVFTAASGANLQTGQVSVPVSSLFTAWYQSSAAAPYGSQFTLTQPFTVNGNLQAVSSVAVTLTNSVGTSASASATIH
jgi:large repetitive protein